MCWLSMSAGTNVKILATGQNEPRKFPSGPTLTAEQMVAGVKELAGTGSMTWSRSAIPGRFSRNRPVAEPHNLAPGWVGFDFEGAFGAR